MSRYNFTSRMLALTLVFVLFVSPVSVFGEESPEELQLETDFDAIPVSLATPDTLPATSAILMEQHSGQVLYEQNADEKLPPASVTKVMTLLLVMEALESGKIQREDSVSVSEYAASMGGSQIWLEPGEQMTVDDLLKAVTISSANDASVALGEHVSGSNDVFVAAMNQRAQELGMAHTTFLNCTGLDESGHETTARDIAKMSRELIQHPLIVEYSTIWMDTLRGGETELANTNKLIRFYKGATGLKTGTTSGAGSCLAATATRDHLSFVAVVMGCATSNDRFSSARGLLDFGFANYTSLSPPPIDDELSPVVVRKGVEREVPVTYQSPGNFVVEKAAEQALTQEVTLVDDVEAPVVEGQILGRVEVVISGEVVGEYDLCAAAAVERLTVGKAYTQLLQRMLRLHSEPPDAPSPAPPAAAAEREAESTPENTI